jgi:hypothetical protein
LFSLLQPSGPPTTPRANIININIIINIILFGCFIIAQGHFSLALTINYPKNTEWGDSDEQVDRQTDNQSRDP